MLSDDEEERLNGYMAAMNEVRFKGSSGRGSLPDLLRLVSYVDVFVLPLSLDSKELPKRLTSSSLSSA